jgi:hypothetical protein
MGAAFAAVLEKSKRSRHKDAQSTIGTTTSNTVDQESINNNRLQANDTAAAFAAILMESQRSRQARLGTQEMARTAAFASGLLGSQQSRQEDTEGGVGNRINNSHLQAHDMTAAFAAILAETRGSSQYGFGTRGMAAAFAAGVVFWSRRSRQQDIPESKEYLRLRQEI